MAINISDVATTSVSDGETISASTENSNNNALKNKINEILDDLNDLTLNDMVGSTGDATLDNTIKLWMDGFWAYRVDGDNIGTTIGSGLINKKTRELTSAITNTTYTTPDNNDWLDIWILADAVTTVPTVSIVDSGTVPGGSANPGTNGRLVASIRYIDGTSKITQWRQFRPNMVLGWTATTGDGTNNLNNDPVFGVTFKDYPIVLAQAFRGTGNTTRPLDINDLTTGNTFNTLPGTITTTGFDLEWRMNDPADTFTSSQWYGAGFVAFGRYE